MTTDILDRFMDGAETPDVDMSGMQSLAYEVRHGDMVVACVSSMREARKVSKFYRNFFGGTYDIIETRTASNGVEVFSGSPATFSHVPSHVPSDAPMYDIVQDAQTVAHNLTMGAAHDFIRELIVADMRKGGAQNADAAADDILATFTAKDIADIYGVSTVRINPAQNSAPAPVPGKTEMGGAWKPVKKIGRAATHKVRELEYMGTPAEFREWAIVEVDTLRIAYEGTKQSATAYLSARLAAGDKLRTMRAIRISKYAAYKADVLLHGYRVVSHGVTLCMGTRQEVSDYIISAYRDGKISPETAKAERISPETDDGMVNVRLGKSFRRMPRQSWMVTCETCGHLSGSHMCEK